MLEFTLEYRRLINVITEDRSTELRKFEMSNEEWEIAGQLYDILRIFNNATLYFSRSMPSLPMIIPAMNIINEHLTDHSLDEQYLPCIRITIGLTKKTLNCYYNEMNQLNVYRITIVLYPSHKLAYFKNAGWKQE
ncbi:hypothetical protein SCP_1900730 [Sparassis crispa]|uniref:Uncharacterized protein n=1 Tax=Sparassis crispa TaxID=139825 RepID=A0A401H728_9APHY|nr:hypothetical protein SCP_1900730 [Sparassis crispa]GBE90224.1 hypothetical protein SCP_1900730 [Sparassis crispa]